MELKTKNITLRHAILSDAKILFEIEQDEDTKKNMMSHTGSIEESKNSLKKEIVQYKQSKPISEKFIIEFNGEVAGYISIDHLNQPFYEHKASLSYALHPNFRKKGIMTEAITLIVDYSFKKYDLVRIEARCRTFNKGSARVLEKSGFVLEGIYKKELCKNGIYLDNMHWAIVK